MPESAERFEGHDGRECGEHRTTGHRAWCFDCSEWCYPTIPCRGCELPSLRQRAEEAERLAAEYRMQVDDPDSLLTQLDEARDAIADERRGRLAAEAAVRRVKHVLAWKTLLAGPQAEKAVRVADVEAALDAERDKARAAVADEQRRADERRTELLNALGEAERRAEQAEAETTALRERAENAEDRLRKATDAYTRLHAEATGTEATGDRWRQRAEEAERRAAEYRMQVDDPDSLLHALDQARDAIADERRGRLAAEAAVRRAHAVIDEALPDWEDTRAYHRERADRKGYSHDEAVAETSERAIQVMTAALAALDAEQPKETPDE